MSLFILDESGRTSSVTDLNDTISATSESSADRKASKKADLAGPALTTHAELEKILPQDYNPLLTQRKRKRLSSIFAVILKTIYVRNPG